jgi:phosphoserine phosphatase RsbU/P
MKKLPLFLLLMLGTCAVLRGQTFDLQTQRLPMASLDGVWRFHPGDDPAWANPDFDDSKWALLRSDQDWGVQGYPKLSGVAWYRFEVRVPKDLARVAVLFPRITTCYQVFADGKLIGTVGKMPPNRMPYETGKTEYFPLPAPQAGSGKIVVALRVWHWPGWTKYYGGGPDGRGLVGDANLIETEAEYRMNTTFRKYTLDLLMCILEVLTGFGALILFGVRRRDKEYLWLCLMLLPSAVEHFMIFGRSRFVQNVELFDLTINIPSTVSGVALILFLLEVLQPRKTWLLKLAFAALALTFVVVAFESLSASYLGDGFESAVIVACEIPVYVWVISVTVTSRKRNSLDGRLLVVPVVISTVENMVSGIAWSTYAFGFQHKFDGFVNLTNDPFPIDLTTVVEAIFLLGLSGILVLRFARARSEEERITAEVQAAQEVQQYFIPAQLPAIPGFKIESAYRPAREVGGDFFQVLPQTDGSLLVLLGDVAGKGLQAGMLATLIVGAVRTAAKFTTDPSHVMALLNERLQGRGLVTCLAMLIEKDGTTTLVNAGHLPPYLNGIELALEGTLPLGALAELEYCASHFKLEEGDSLMLMSDGIVEAQDKNGHLFGFERIGALMHKSASAADLAEAAQDFGQEDDITVLTVARLMPAMAG